MRPDLRVLLARGRVVRAYLGFGGPSRPVDRRLAQVLEVPGERAIDVTNVANTPAAIAGLRAGDFHVAIDGRPVETVDVHRMLGPEAIGRALTVTFVSEGRCLDTTVTPGEAP
jgi:S1-C subfamily serine protease